MTINRKEAIELLCKEQLNVLDKDTRESYILNWWVLDEEEHALGIVFKNKNIIQIGYADVCFSKF